MHRIARSRGFPHNSLESCVSYPMPNLLKICQRAWATVSVSLFGMATSSMRQVARSMMVSALNLVGSEFVGDFGIEFFLA